MSNKEKNIFHLFLCFVFVLLLTNIFPLLAQPSYTADDKVVEFGASFGFGVNPGYYGDISSGSGFDREGVSYDVALAQLARQVGINTWRPTLPAYFFLQYGNSSILSDNNFEIRSNEFKEYKKLGMNNHVVFIGDATDHQDGDNASSLTGKEYRNIMKYAGCDKYSYEFKNMYEPIWDDGANGTPVNDNNYYALYIYKLVSKYKDYIKVYEVVNEIDFKGNGTANPEADAGSNGGENWYDRNPSPCELLNWRAPIFSYIRMLRITYEVVKTVDPSAFVAIGGIGYESFLDVVLRNSDNPDNGNITSKFPKKGGAYFDVLSYHLYPQYDLKKKDANGDNVYPFVHQRHSDEAVERTLNKKDRFQTVLSKYKYDGAVGNYPKKHFIITETNVPRRKYDGTDWIGSDEAQKNFAVKVMVKAHKKDIKQVHLFKLGESTDISDVSNKEAHEGLYENLKKAKRTKAIKTLAGKALQTVTALLDSLTYDEIRTIALALPANVEGAAFKSEAGKYLYVLWAKTITDNSETATADYTFISTLNINGLKKVEWDYYITGNKTTLTSSKISLTSSPAYFTDASNPVDFNTLIGQNFIVSGIPNALKNNVTELSSYPNPFTKTVEFVFNLANSDIIGLDISSITGEIKATLLSGSIMPAGEHSIISGNLNLPAGIYFGNLYSKKTGRKSVIKLAVE